MIYFDTHASQPYNLIRLPTIIISHVADSREYRALCVCVLMVLISLVDHHSSIKFTVHLINFH
ncbi:hypothetical protein Hanom_Chr10g00960701 [Helianthus anomalus]